MKTFRQFLVATIVSALFFSSLTQRVVALENEPIVPNPVISESAVLDPSQDVPVSEVVEKREANVKHFLTDNFRTMAMIYPVSVHYQENGSWNEIDNTLIDTTDELQNEVVENKSGGIKIRLAKNSQSTKLVSMKLGDIGLSWTFENIAKKAIRVIQPSAEKDNDLTTVENLTSSVRYLDVFNDVDLEYVLQGDEVKENLILKSKDAERSFTQVFRFNGLTPVKQEDGTIALVDTEGNIVFRLERFLMVDAKGEESQAIETSFTHVGDSWELTIRPDEGWLNDPERVYPVVVDPTVTTPITYADIDDAHVTKTLPSSNFYNSYILKTGEAHRTYLRFTLPHLTAADMVIYASLEMSLANTGSISQNDYQVNAHKVTGSWSETTLTWNNKPAYNPKIEDYEVVGHSNVAQAYLWNITSIVKEWYSSGVNNGLMLKDNNEIAGYGYKEYYSADTSSTYQSYRPVVTMVYVNNNGLESYWTYHSQNVGRAGTGYTNDSNGNLVFIRQDTFGTGNRMPVSVSHVYNLNDRSTNTNFGNGWRLNYSQQAGSQVIGGVTYHFWIDEDGTKHYFAYDATQQKYLDEAGTQLEMVKNADTTYTLKDAQGNLSKFNSAGKLTEIQNSDGQKITLIYTGALLTEIRNPEWNSTDYVNRRTILTYTNNLLTSITAVDGKITNFAYTGTQLTSVTEVFDAIPANNKVSTYTYDGSGTDQYKLLTATNFDGYKLTYSYSSLKPYRVIKFSESQGSTLGEELNLSYGYNATFFTDFNSRKSIYTFNNAGNTVTIQDPDGYAQYYNYNESGSVKNSMALESKLQKSVVNHLVNTSYETTGSWVIESEGGSTGTIGDAAAQKYIGTLSMVINKTNSIGRHYFTQTLTGLTKGKSYTFSAYVKTTAMATGTNIGALLSASYKNAAGTWVEIKSKYLTGVFDWQRLEMTFTLPLDAATTEVRVRPIVENAIGVAFFDALQLEEGTIANRYNLIENGNMDLTTSWTFGGGTDVNDKILTLTSDLPPTSLNNDVLRIIGAYNQNKQAYQFVNASGVANDVFVVSGWSKAASAPLGKGNRVALYLRFDNTDGTYTYRSKDFNTDTSEWQFLSFNAIADKAYSRVGVILVYSYNVNTAYFDGIGVFKDEFGQSYTYDSKGNVISVVDLAKQTSSFAYTNNDLTLATDAKGNNYTYTYDANHKITGASSAELVKYSFKYEDAYGNATSATIGDGTNGTKQITTSTTYTTDGNYVATKKDALDNTVTYSINSLNGLVNSVTDPLLHTVTNQYNSDDSLKQVSTTLGGQTVSNSYTYENDRLKTITHNNFAYTFVYDTFGNVTQVKVGTTNLITNTYKDRTSRLDSFVYGNGDSVEYVFDSFDRITGVKIDGTLRTTYDYDANGVVGRVTDVSTGKSTRYVYDFANRLAKVVESDGNSVSFGYDANNNASTFIDTVNGTTYTTSYTYDKDNRPTLVTSPKANTTGYVYDVLGRLTSKTWTSGSTAYTTAYTYKDHPTDTSRTSTQLSSIQNGTSTPISYLYDANGNITSITEGTNTIQYLYNELNEVVRENNQRDNKTFVYNYDLGGNLLSKVQYAYTTGTLGTPVSTISYAYTNSNWKDLLTSFNGKAITYDVIGNPLTYDGGTYGWEGRKLTSFNKTGLAISYTYNENGIRTSKTVNGVKTEYRLSGDKVTFEKTGSDTIYYVYDTQGQLVSMILNGTEYAYLRNAQNDIVGLINSSGTQVVSYTYSTWGEVLTVTGSLASTLGVKNPYRYRGYRYDSETGLYYLQSRYYNPQWGRFVNSDDVYITRINKGSIYDKNVFAYCDNNPVSRRDASGHLWDTVFDVISLGSSILQVVSTPSDPWAWAGLAADVVSLAVPFVTGGSAVTRIISKIDNIDDVVEVRKATDFTQEALSEIGKLDKVGDCTKSTAKQGIKIHKGYKVGFGDAKEVRRFPGIRPDFVDEASHIIFELKPNNPRAIKAGIQQLKKYNEVMGGGYKLVLELY